MALATMAAMAKVQVRAAVMEVILKAVGIITEADMVDLSVDSEGEDINM